MHADALHAYPPEALPMKIENSAKPIGPVPGSAGSRVSGTRPAVGGVRAAETSAGQTAAVVSTTLSAVGGAEATFNSQKVAEIRQAISEGRFQIDPEKIADGLLNSVREMLAQRDGRTT
jgi:negative regulator of flagellin synthesis FlgM